MSYTILFEIYTKFVFEPPDVDQMGFFAMLRLGDIPEEANLGRRWDGLFGICWWQQKNGWVVGYYFVNPLSA